MLQHFLRAMSTSITSRSRPVVAIIGTTGSGKSQLAVSLAQSLSSLQTTNRRDNPNPTPRKGVILSADSMQLYKGLNVITNKVTLEEMGGVQHWGLDVVQPGVGGSWDVGRWCGEADKQIASMDPSTLPIICGGTHYFIQHFLFPPSDLSFERSEADLKRNAMETRWKPPCSRPGLPYDMDEGLLGLLDTFWTKEPKWPRGGGNERQVEEGAGGQGSSSRMTIEEDERLLSLWKVLEAVDPKEAGRWHWRDGRKVRRGIERWWERGVVKKGEETEGAHVTEKKGRRARFRTLIFWVYEDMESLAPRLDKRVDKMLDNGLLDEIVEMREIAERMYGSSDATDHSEGIFQAIGYKEFAPLSLSQPDPRSDKGFESMLKLAKTRTQQYAKYQLKWIRKQLLPAVWEARSLGGEVEVYIVRGGDGEEGELAAKGVLRAFLLDQDLPPAAGTGHSDAGSLLAGVYSGAGHTSVPDTLDRQILNSRQTCEICTTSGKPVTLSRDEWRTHLSSRAHIRAVRDKEGYFENMKAEQIAKGMAKRLERDRLKAGTTLEEVVSDP